MKTFDYKDVVLVPKMGILESRSQADTSIRIIHYDDNGAKSYFFKSPVIPANMESIINEDICIELAKNGYFYILHRFNIDSFSFVKKMKNLGLVSSISIGVGKESYDLIDKFINEKIYPDFITIDIAHGHSIVMKDMISYIRKVGIKSFIIAGNISTYDAAIDLIKWGANSIKVGIAGGEACITYHKTSFGSRYHNASTILEIRKALSRTFQQDMLIIADGGIRQPGHISVALRMGANMVMVGGMLAAHIDSPGSVIEENGEKYKLYWGSASPLQNGKKNRIEGKAIKKKLIEKTILEEMDSICEDLQSSISYSGGKKLNDILKVDYVIIKR